MKSEAVIEKIARSKPVFLSHASKDKALADALTDLLTNGCAVNPNDILCTSLEGKGIPTGTPSFIEFLRGQIQKPELVILLLSENFFASHFCMCELGAVWGMELPNFPLVVPGTERGKLKAVLAVAQAGEINSVPSLDELRDVVKKLLGTDVPTPTWTVKRDAFLNGLGEVMKALAKPVTVSAAEFEAAKAQYQAAMVEIRNKEKEVKTLKAHVADLENCKDREQVKAVTQKYSNEPEQFAKLVSVAKASLSKLRRATEKAIFAEERGGHYIWDGEDEWNDVRDAEQLMELDVVQSYGKRWCQSRSEHIRVARVKDALMEIGSFLKDESHADFLLKLEDEHQFPIDLKNKEFWNRILESYV
jgi:TIR domain